MTTEQPADDDNDSLSSENLVDDAALERLQDAVRNAGGPSEIARRSGVPLRTLQRYLKGREMRRPELVAIARACEVSLDWLAAGDGPRERRSDTDRPRGLFAILDVPRFIRATELAQEIIKVRGRSDAASALQITALVYDMMTYEHDGGDLVSLSALLDQQSDDAG